jgi:hypothetical protein
VEEGAGELRILRGGDAEQRVTTRSTKAASTVSSPGLVPLIRLSRVLRSISTKIQKLDATTEPITTQMQVSRSRCGSKG